MRGVLAIVALLLFAPVPSYGDDVLPSRDLEIAMVEVRGLEPADFDLIDFRAEERRPAATRTDTDPHSLFVIKRHVGAALGYDNGIIHTGIGLYLTVAELGRWNFGIPAVEFGIGRYPVFDPKRNMSFTKDQPTILISLASVHYRVAYLRSFGYTFYLNLEQVYDMRTNFAGSQFGFSFARK